MIQFSSNANTDYLLGELGNDTVQDLMEELNARNHDTIYPVVSALLLPTYLADQDQHERSTEEMVTELEDWNMETYGQMAWEVHEQLEAETLPVVQGELNLPNELQRV